MAISSKRNNPCIETDLKVGDVVRVGDQEWYDSLPEYTGKYYGTYFHNGVEKWPNQRNNVIFTEGMKRFLGKRVVVEYVFYDNDVAYYSVSGVDEELSYIDAFTFTNDMLFED